MKYQSYSALNELVFLQLLLQRAVDTIVRLSFSLFVLGTNGQVSLGLGLEGKRTFALTASFIAFLWLQL